MKLSLNKFFLIFFLTTSVLPIIGLSVIHIQYLHKILNHNQSFLHLIEHEELILFYAYTVIVVIGISACLILFKRFILTPISNIINKFDAIASGQIPGLQTNSKYYLREVSGFIEKFNHMIRVLEDSKRQKEDFIATLTHDLRTPIIAEQKAFQLLKQYQLDPKTSTQLIDSLIHSNNDLVALIEMLLENLKYESGEIRINKSLISADLFFQQCLSAIYPLYEEHNIALNLQIDPGLKLNIDTVQFKRVIGNLMFNALENSPAKTTVTLEVQVSDSEVVIKVRDQGYGIAENLLLSVFDRYCSSKDRPGAGLGLYVSKLILEKHGASIEVFSKINQGTSFHIYLPK